MDGLDAADRDLLRAVGLHARGHDLACDCLSGSRARRGLAHPDHARRPAVHLARHGPRHSPCVVRDEAGARKWMDSEFQPSTLAKDDQMKEMQWFIKAAAPFKGMEINAVSETLTVHEYESKTLTKAFEEITGIKVKHDIIQEGDVVEKMQTQMHPATNVYDGWINDSDFIGTHFRYGEAVDLTDYMAGEGKDVTDPQLDVNDFIGKSFTTAPNGHLYQLPDQQFANLYWVRYDWFSNPDYTAKSKAKYGYDLGVPVNWSAS